MDNFDKNQVDKDLLEKVDEILTGEKVDEVPDLVFSEEVPKDYDISQDINAGMNASVNAANNAAGGSFEPEVEIPDAGFNYNAPQAPDFGSTMPQGNWNGTQQNAPYQNMQQTGANNKASGNPNLNTQATIGLIVGIIAVAISFIGLRLGALPVAIGIAFCVKGMKSEKRMLAIIGLVLNIIGAILWIAALPAVFSSL